MLAVVETHPIQYHAPVYRALQQDYGVPVTAIYGSDFSLRRYRDAEFGADVAWDGDLLSGYQHHFLSRGGQSDEPNLARMSARGVAAALDAARATATLIVGYSPAFHRQAWYAAWRHHRPILFRGETTDVGQKTPAAVRGVKAAGLRLAYRTCARVLYIGEQSRRHYRRLGVADANLEFSPYCVDTTPFATDERDRVRLRDTARSELQIGADAFVVLFAGKLSARKGVDLLVPAVTRLPPDLRARTVLICLGDGVLRDALAVLAADRGVSIRFTGLRPQREMSGFYHAADVLALPSRHGETWGLVVNEALHHGLPCVVSSAVGCALDLVTASTGVTCAANSIEALGDALARASALAGRDEIRARCRTHVSRYSVDRAAEGIARAYRAVVSPVVAA